MSIQSIKEDGVYIEDPQKAKEIKDALNSDECTFANVKPNMPTYDELYEHWLKTNDKPKKKHKKVEIEQSPGQLDLFNIIDKENDNDSK